MELARAASTDSSGAVIEPHVPIGLLGPLTPASKKCSDPDRYLPLIQKVVERRRLRERQTMDKELKNHVLHCVPCREALGYGDL